MNGETKTEVFVASELKFAVLCGLGPFGSRSSSLEYKEQE